MALNPELFARLKAKFGDVQIVRPNETYRPVWQLDPITGRRSRGLGTVNGEAYRLNCPYCGDAKGRLYVNHMWMQWDADAARSVDDMIKCFNEENCFSDPEKRSQFHTMTYGDTPWFGVSGIVAPSDNAINEKPLIPEPPGTVISLKDMNPLQPCISYLTGRGYNIQNLVDWYNIGYVTTVSWGHHVDCLNRIYIPMSFEGRLVGYQCRYIGDRVWTPECPKYRTMRRMARSKYLYNFDVARRSRIVVVVEGPSSVWTVGTRSVALWSKSLSHDQMQLLRTYWGDDCLIVVMVDGSAVKESQKIFIQLKSNCDTPIVRAEIPFTDDPGTLGEERSWQAIHDSCKKQGINVFDYFQGENASVQPAIVT